MISVLCVDDDPAYLDITKRYLEEPGALTVTTALSVADALKEMGTNRFDVIVADYQMPVMNGIEFLRAVRAENPILPFILFTGKGREEVVIEAFNSGADFYLRKTGEPKVQFALLKDTIRKAVEIGAGRKEVHDSETRYRRLFETATDGILILDGESGKITDANPLLLTMLGYTRDEILGKNIWDLGIIREKSRAEKAAAELKKTGFSWFDDLPLKTKDGHDIAVEFVSKVFDAETQKVIQINIREIAERKRAEEVLKSSESRYRRFFEAVRDGILILDAETGTILDVNPFLIELLGFTHEQFLGKKLWEIGVFKDIAASKDNFRELQEKKYIHFEDLPLETADGRRIYVEFVSFVYDVENKNVMQCNIRDITERKRAEAALTRSEERFRQVAENAGVWIWETDENGLFTYASPVVENILGYTPEDLVGKKYFFDLFAPDIREDLKRKALADFGRRDTFRNFINTTIHKNGSRVILETSGAPIIDNDGHLLGYRGTDTDITERIQTEQALRESEERYNALFFNSYSVSLLIDPDTGRIVDANNAAERYYGYSRDQLRSMGIYDLNRQPHDTVVRNLLRAKGEGAKHFFSTHFLASGEKRSVEIFSGPITVQGKTIFYSITHDISDRKKAETALARSEVRNRTVLENVPDLILVHRNGFILYTNPPAAEIIGYTSDELHNKQLIDLIVPEYRPLVTQAISGRMAGKIIEPYEIEILTKSGHRRTVIIRGSLIEFDGSSASLNVLTDITERKLVEVALRKSSTLLNDVCGMGHVGGWELDVTTKEVLWTRETYRIHEISEDEKFDLSKAILFYDLPGRSTLEEALERCMEKGESFDLELPFTSAKGRHLWTRAMGHAVYEGGTLVKLTGTFQDITERKTAEEAMKTFSEDLDRKVLERTSNLGDVNLNLMTEIDIRLNAEKQLSKNLHEKEVLLREVHHRVKNNLQIIISLLNLQSRFITDEATLSAFRECQNRVRAMALVHEKLYRSTDLATIDLDNYIRFLGSNLLDFFGTLGKGITLTMDIHDIFLAIDTAIPFGLIINELISNSLKYAFPGGRKGEISISIHRQDHTLTILYKDNGVGISEDFDWRNAKSMGLQLITALVDQLDGTIELDRTAGTLFTMVVHEKEQKGSS